MAQRSLRVRRDRRVPPFVATWGMARPWVIVAVGALVQQGCFGPCYRGPLPP